MKFRIALADEIGRRGLNIDVVTVLEKSANITITNLKGESETTDRVEDDGTIHIIFE